MRWHPKLHYLCCLRLPDCIFWLRKNTELIFLLRSFSLSVLCNKLWIFWVCLFFFFVALVLLQCQGLITFSYIYKLVRISAGILILICRFINCRALAVTISAVSICNKHLWFEVKRTISFYLKGSGHRRWNMGVYLPVISKIPLYLQRWLWCTGVRNGQDDN